MAAALLLLACSAGPNDPNTVKLSKEPISVRGWIAAVETPGNDPMFRTVETEAARRTAVMQGTSVWVENAPYVSGGVAENGSFILLDVPPGNVTVEFTAPGVPVAKVRLENIPGNADVLIPGLVLKPDGTAVADPKGLQVRLAAKIARPRATKLSARVAGVPVAVVEVPTAAMVDRRDYPNPPGFGPAPLATVR